MGRWHRLALGMIIRRAARAAAGADGGGDVWEYRARARDGAAKGYPFICVMSEAFSIERRKMMRFLGAKVVLTNPAHKFGGMLQTMALKEKHGYYWPNQFENEANARIHRHRPRRDPEAMAGDRRLLCARAAPGGTLKGVGQVRARGVFETKLLPASCRTRRCR